MDPSLLLSACDRHGPFFELEASALGVSHLMLVSDYFRNAPDGTLFVFGGQIDISGSYRYRHKVHGWEIYVEPHGLAGVNLATTSLDDIAKRIEDLKFSSEAKQQVASVAMHLHENYESVIFDREALPELMLEIFSRLPLGSKLVIVLDHERVRDIDGRVVSAAWLSDYAHQIRSIVAPYPFVGVTSFGDHVRSDDEIHIGGNHYDRMVYYRMAEAIATAFRSLTAKTVGPAPFSTKDIALIKDKRKEMIHAAAETHCRIPA